MKTQGHSPFASGKWIFLIGSFLFHGFLLLGLVAGFSKKDSDDETALFAGGSHSRVSVEIVSMAVSDFGITENLQTDSKKIAVTKKENKVQKNATQVEPSASGQGNNGQGQGIGSGIGAGIDQEGQSASLLGEIRKKILAKKRYPDVARDNLWAGTVLVEFAIAPSGDLSFVKVVKSSGYSVLDDAALASVKKAQPLPFYSKKIALAIEYKLAQ